MAASVIALVAAHQFGSSAKKAVMMCLAQHADGDTASTFVGQTTIACETEYSERTIQRTLAELEEDGLIRRQPRMRSSGRGRTSDLTTIVASAVKARPRCRPYVPEDQPATGSGWSDQPDTDAGPTRHWLPDQPDTVAGEPSVEPKEREKSGGRGSRVDPDFKPSPETELIKKHGLSDGYVQTELEKFIDYWLGVSGAKGVKRDWQATWRNWLRNSVKFSGAKSSSQVRSGGRPSVPDWDRSEPSGYW